MTKKRPGQPKTTQATSRRRLLAGMGAGAATLAAAGGLSAPAVAQGRVRLTMVTAWPENAPGVGVNAQRYADRVAALSDGAIEVVFHAAGKLVPPFESLDAVQQGTADLAHATPYYWVGKSRALHFFTGVPFGMTAVEFASWLRFGGGQELWEEVYADFGVLPFYVGSSGTQAGGWFKREINSVSDFEGLKFRVAGLGGEVLKRLGVIPVLMPPGEIFPAMASGAVDGADWVGPWNDVAFGLYKVAKYYYMPGFHEPGPSLEVIVNQERFEQLPLQHQTVLREAARATAMDTLADFTFHNIETFGKLQSEFGVEVRRFSDDIVKRLGEESRAVLADLGQSDPLTGRIYDAYMAFLAKANAYAPNAEQGFLNMRTQVL